jgi:uncharacterized NAD(P)/FAD-binding protein YdhS
MNKNEHIALVGCGFTGTSASFQLVDRYPIKEITIFEASGEFGPGYPYQTKECRDYLINNTTDTMCLVASNRRAFLDWLRGQQDLQIDLDPSGHLPRSIYGAFLKDIFATTQRAAGAKGISVNLVPCEVTAINETANGRVEIGWSNGNIVADAAILTTGRCPDVDDYPRPTAGAPARYLTTHVMSTDFDDLALDAVVHVLGASLSAYDVINRVFSADTGCRFVRDADGALIYEAGGNERRVVLCSRSGRLKGMQSRHPIDLSRQYLTIEALRKAACSDGLRLSDLEMMIKREANEHGIELDWSAIIDPYRECASSQDVSARAAELLSNAIDLATSVQPRNFLVDLCADAQVEIWDAFAERLLKADEELLYRDRIESAAFCYFAPCPVLTGEKLLALHRAGRLSFIKGAREVRLSDDEATYSITHDFGEERAAVLVNATSSVDRDISSPRQSKLIKSLANRGLLSSYMRNGQSMKGVSVDMTTFRANSRCNIYVANMLLWGPGFFTSSAFTMASIIDRLLCGMFSVEYS